MSANSLHHQVEDRIRRKKHLCDFNDFVKCVDSVGKDFFDFKSWKSKAKDTNYPKLAKISEVQFYKGDTKMFWKTSFEESECQSSEFQQKKFPEQCRKEILRKKKGPTRGFNMQENEADIVQKFFFFLYDISFSTNNIKSKMFFHTAEY